MGLFRKGKTRISAKLHGTDLIICTHSKEGNTPSYSRINTKIALVNDMYCILINSPGHCSLQVLLLVFLEPNMSKKNKPLYGLEHEPSFVGSWSLFLQQNARQAFM